MFYSDLDVELSLLYFLGETILTSEYNDLTGYRFRR